MQVKDLKGFRLIFSTVADSYYPIISNLKFQRSREKEIQKRAPPGPVQSFPAQFQPRRSNQSIHAMLSRVIPPEVVIPLPLIQSHPIPSRPLSIPNQVHTPTRAPKPNLAMPMPPNSNQTPPTPVIPLVSDEPHPIPIDIEVPTTRLRLNAALPRIRKAQSEVAGLCIVLRGQGTHGPIPEGRCERIEDAQAHIAGLRDGADSGGGAGVAVRSEGDVDGAAAGAQGGVGAVEVVAADGAGAGAEGDAVVAVWEGARGEADGVVGSDAAGGGGGGEAGWFGRGGVGGGLRGDADVDGAGFGVHGEEVVERVGAVDGAAACSDDGFAGAVGGEGRAHVDGAVGGGDDGRVVDGVPDVGVVLYC